MKKVALAILAVIVLAGCGSASHSSSNNSGSSNDVGVPGASQQQSQQSGPTDQSSSIAQDIQSSSRMQSFLQNGYTGASVSISAVNCVESGGTQSYSCQVNYDVSGAQNSSDDGSYTIGASATCDNTGNCQWQTNSLGSASKQ